MDGLSVYGGTGFVGGHYHRRHGGILIERNERTPQTDDVLYFISTTDNYNVFTDVHVDINTNLNILMETLEACRKKNIKGTFNFISSWFVYGRGALTPVSETSRCQPRGFYSITKYTAEQLLISYCETFGMKYRILRLGNVVGKGDDRVSAKKNALQFLINKMKKDEPIELYEGGDFCRDYIHAHDCVDAINLVINSGETDKAYNIANGEGIVFKDIVDLAYKKIGSKSVITSIPQKEFHKIVQVRSMYMDIERIKSLGYAQKYTMSDILDDMIN